MLDMVTTNELMLWTMTSKLAILCAKCDDEGGDFCCHERRPWDFINNYKVS